VLVTGGLGFTGQAVARELLDHGHQVVALTHRPGPGPSAPTGADVAHADLRDQAAVARVLLDAGIEGVCHLAALTRVRDSFVDPIAYFDVNVGGTVQLLAALNEQTGHTGQPVWLVFGSTGAVYGIRDGQLDEDELARPENPYGASKLAAEQLIGYHASNGNLAAISLRCFNIAGAVAGVGDPDTSRIIPKAIAVAAGVADRLQVNGDGGAIREYTHVADVAHAYRLALEAAQPGKHRIYNVGSGNGVTVMDVVDTVRRLSGRPVPVEHLPPKPEPRVLMADSSRIRTELGWSPTWSKLDQIVDDAWDTVRSVA
jgi:UDP-glucose 4-epimerase